MLIRDYNRDIVNWIIERDQLTIQEVCEAIGRKRQVVDRWRKGQSPTSEHVEALLTARNCSPVDLAEYTSQWMTENLGVQVYVDPEMQARYLPTVPLARASQRYKDNLSVLDREQRDLIEEKLQQARLFEAAAEQMVSSAARDVHREIDRAVAAKQAMQAT
ncbi:MAG: helix-turn-helix transcriptional regulator [Acidobacteriota bacterium]